MRLSNGLVLNIGIFPHMDHNRVSEWLLFWNHMSNCFQLYLGGNMYKLHSIRWWWCPTRLVGYVLAHWKNSPRVDMSLESDTLTKFRWGPCQSVFILTPGYCVLSGETVITNFIVVGLTRLGLEHTIYRTRLI